MAFARRVSNSLLPGMKSILTVFLLVFGAAWCGLGDSFLQLNGVDGPSRKDKYSGWIPITGFSSRGASSKTVGGALPLFSAVKPVDSVSPSLAVKCSEGAKILSGVMESTVTNKSGAGFFLQVRLTNLVVSACRQSGSQFSSPLTELVDLSPATIQWTYTQLAGIRTLGAAASRAQAVSGSLENAAGEPGFRSTGTLLPGGVIRIQWTPQPGRRYRLMGSPRLEGPFEFVRNLDDSSATDEASIELPTSGPFQFFRVERE